MRRKIQRKCYAKRKGIVYKLKSKPCADCHIEYPPCAMEFDHLPQFKKSFVICAGISHKGTMALIKEIQKCEVVCANCHAIRTYKRLQEKIAKGSINGY